MVGETYCRCQLKHRPMKQPTALLQSISMSLSDVQRQLSTIQEQNVQCDQTFRQLEMNIQELKTNKIPAPLEETPKRSQKSPRGLSVSLSIFESTWQYKYYFWSYVISNRPVFAESILLWRKSSIVLVNGKKDNILHEYLKNTAPLTIQVIKNI